MANPQEKTLTNEEELLLVLSDVAIIILEYMESMQQQIKATNINAANYKEAKPEMTAVFNSSAANLITLNDILHPMFDILPRLFPEKDETEIKDFLVHRRRHIAAKLLPNDCDCTYCIWHSQFDEHGMLLKK